MTGYYPPAAVLEALADGDQSVTVNLRSMAADALITRRELADARAEIAALRNDLEAKTSDFDAALRHLGETRARAGELEAAQAASLHLLAGDVLDGGWRPPAHAIATAAELDTLPSGSIVVSDWGRVWLRGPGQGRWWESGSAEPMTSAEVFAAVQVGTRHGATLCLVHVAPTAVVSGEQTPYPSADSLLGADPDWTGGLTVDAYMDQVRRKDGDTE